MAVVCSISVYVPIALDVTEQLQNSILIDENFLLGRKVDEKKNVFLNHITSSLSQ